MRISRRRTITGDLETIESLWYNVERWPSWVDGVRQIETVAGSWPETGGSVVWRSGPYGRGEVHEKVKEYAAGGGQLIEWDDDQMEGTQELGFLPDSSNREVKVLLTIEFRVKGKRGPINAVVNGIFVRSQVGQMMTRTLDGFAGLVAEQ